jgi:hypothetical protein
MLLQVINFFRTDSSLLSIFVDEIVCMLWQEQTNLVVGTTKGCTTILMHMWECL